MDFPAASPTSEKSGSTVQKKRSARACDRCRKYRNKCIRTVDSEPCEGCRAANLECTFEDPNFKRGPPKGYIQAIEHRLKLVETVLGAIVASEDTSAQAVVAKLNKDELANDVLDRVHNGPYGAPATWAAEEAISESPASSTSTRTRPAGHGAARAPREPRTERELMSFGQDDHNIPPNWQNILINNLSNPSSLEGAAQAWARARGEGGHDEVINRPAQFPRDVFHTTAQATIPRGNSSELTFLNLIVDNSLSGQSQFSSNIREWQSPDRFNIHSNAAPNLIGSENVWPDVQKQLFELYFNHVHPLFPMVKMSSFSSPPFTAARKAQNEFLMLSMFSSASLYRDQTSALGDSAMYFSSAKQLLGNQAPSLPACQGLILLAYYEVATGTFEQAWIYLGMAVHMAKALGLNRRVAPGSLTIVQEEEYNNTWWSCVVLDKNLACSLGFRPAISEVDADIDMPRLASQRPRMTELESRQLEPEYLMAYFRELARLSLIVGNILEESEKGSLGARRNEYQVELLDWRASLREELRCETYEGSPVSSAPVLTMHLTYWSTLMLTNRNLYLSQDLLTGMDEQTHSPSNARRQHPALGQNLLDLLQTAPDEILHISNCHVPESLWLQSDFSLSPIRPRDSRGFVFGIPVSKFEETIGYLKELEDIWPSSTGKWRLLADAKARLDENASSADRLSGPLRRRGMPSRLEIPRPVGQSLRRQTLSASGGHATMSSHPSAGANVPFNYHPGHSGQVSGSSPASVVPSLVGHPGSSSSDLRRDPRSQPMGLSPARWNPPNYAGQSEIGVHNVPGIGQTHNPYLPDQQRPTGAPSQYDLLFPNRSHQDKPASGPG